MNKEVNGPLRLDPAAGIAPEIVQSERRLLEAHSRLRVIHWLVIFLSIVLTVSIWQYSRVQVALRTEARFDHAANQIADLITERLEKYELALWSGVSALKTHNNDVDLQRWRTFAANLDIEHRYPGINGIGVIHQVAREDLQTYLARERRDRPDYRIYPPHDGDIYQPITYIEPVDINVEAVGLDMMHEENRHTSLNQAKDTATAQITGPIILVQDKGRTPGFLFFAPFYNSDDTGTLESRQASFGGAVYAPFVVKKLMSGVLDKDRRSTAIRITDGDKIIYDEIHAEDADYDSDSLGEKRIPMQLYGREWTLDVRAGLDFRAKNAGFESTALLIACIIIDLALLTLFILLSRANRRGLRFADMATDALNAESRALQETNQELELARAEAESVSEMKSVFLSTMSHEVRTPLTAISGILVLLERAGLPQRENKLVRAGKMASDKLMKLLTDVLDSSRLEADAVELWEREIAVKPLVEEWRTLAEGMIEKLEKDISVVTEISADTPDRIIIDDIRLSQVLNNLMDNAIRFTETGTITISTSAKSDASDKIASVVISLADTGVGIAEEDLTGIFERFRQVDGSLTRARGGAGLGLAISYDLVDLMGGELSVSSQPDKGTCFELRLPVEGTKKKGKDNV